VPDLNKNLTSLVGRESLNCQSYHRIYLPRSDSREDRFSGLIFDWRDAAKDRGFEKIKIVPKNTPRSFIRE